MDNIFQYAFMQKSICSCGNNCVIAPCIGVSIVLKRLSAIGDATSHSALAEVSHSDFCSELNPILGAVMFSILRLSE